MWIETTLRAGTKTPKICRDMFIADTKGSFRLCEVKNGKLKTRVFISKDDAVKIIGENNLVPTVSIFANCYTYRTAKSTRLINKLLSAA